MAVLLLVGGRLLTTYEKYGEFSWGPTSTPPKIQYQGNEYDRGSVEVGFAKVQNLPAGLGLIRSGRFAGGSTVYAASASHSRPAPVVFLLSGHTYVGYGCRCGGD